MTYRFVIPYTLPSLNEYIDQCRRNRYAAAKYKRDIEDGLVMLIKSQLRGISIDGTINIAYLWVERDKRRDLDNVSGMGRKFINDALVKAGTLKNDGWKNITGFTDSFAIDKSNPRIEITIMQGE